MATNEINYSENSVVDLSGDTVNSEVLEEGYTAHDATGTSITGSSTAVHYGKAQSLTEDQKAQARSNIDAMSTTETVVHYGKAQDLTEDQKAQARDNIGALPASGTAVDSAKLGGKAPGYYIRSVNLLDNSDFRNPVNQRGQTTTSAGYVYFIDRWITRTAGAIYSIDENGMTIDATSITNNAQIRQVLPTTLKDGTYTVVLYRTDGSVKGFRVYEITNTTPTRIVNSLFDTDFYVDLGYSSPYYHVQFMAIAGMKVSFGAIALYEGTYTAETLPSYVPKGYGAELTECQRYFVRINCKNKPLGFGHAFTTDAIRILVPTPASMMTHKATTITFETSDGVESDAAGTMLIATAGSLLTPTAVNSDGVARENGVICLCTVSGATEYQPASMYCSGIISFSADL